MSPIWPSLERKDLCNSGMEKELSVVDMCSSIEEKEPSMSRRVRESRGVHCGPGRHGDWGRRKVNCSPGRGGSWGRESELHSMRFGLEKGYLRVIIAPANPLPPSRRCVLISIALPHYSTDLPHHCRLQSGRPRSFQCPAGTASKGLQS